ncbi:MAG TPA: helix-hairpin-helix domain-containing protein [Phycisphaerae bacterium]|nr:helix-hairpin-helix domain-containing protein [Phycisphaerae bacterium]HRY69676.1 helix-hairpin-helix domain-containing protein [Phycisphaerae bacterium]HSA25127.1 helix-hairpin-helix domain-containing protein [Phycisphaerae bacterium]
MKRHRSRRAPSPFPGLSPRCKPTTHDPRRPAAALIFVLWSIALLSLLAGGLSFAIRQDMTISGIQRDRLTAHWAARAGVETAVATIMDQTSSVQAETDLWYDDPVTMQDIRLTGGRFSVFHGNYGDLPQIQYGASDENAKLNVNNASREQLMKLPHMTSYIAGAIIEWRGGNTNQESQADGVGRGYYTGLAHPYTMRDGPVKTVRELLLVRGVTPELLYGEDANGNEILDPNEDDGDASDPPDNADGRLDRGWFSYLTAYSYEKNINASGQKRLNLSSADANTLKSRLGLPRWAAESIVKAREQKKFEHLADLLDVQRDPSIAIDLSEESSDSPANDQPVTASVFASIVDDLTLKDAETLPGRVNINTAPRAVIRALPDVGDELADAIVRYREGGGVYTSIGDLLSISGMTKDRFAKLEDSVTVRSWVFRIQSHGYTESGLAEATIECVVDRGSKVPRILYWLESSP